MRTKQSQFLLVLLLLSCLLIDCQSTEQSQSTINKEKQLIKSIFNEHWKAYELRDIPRWSKMFSTSGDLYMFGTESSEVYRSISEDEANMKNQWKTVFPVKCYDLQNESIILSKDCTLASMLCEVPMDFTVNGKLTHVLLRFACTFRKENGEWKDVHAMFASVSGSS